MKTHRFSAMQNWRALTSDRNSEIETMKDFDKRCGLYVLAMFFVTGGMLYDVYLKTVEASETDPSAMAVWGFAPFIALIYFGYAAVIVVAIAAVVEVVIYLTKLSRLYK